MKFSVKNSARKIALLVLGALALEIGGRGAMQNARAGVLDDIGGAISSLRGQKTRKAGAAQSARSKARSQAEQVEFLHERLLKTQRLLDAANSNYVDSFRRLRRTEQRIAEIQTRAEEVSARYENHKKQFGLRLASMQRHGQTNFLQVALGSMSLSDLSRRTAFFQALTQRDAAMQAQIKGDKTELLQSKNALLAQWKERRDLQKQAARERTRIASGEAQQMQSWKQMNNARYALLSFAIRQEQSLGDIDGKIGNLRARASQVLSENAAREARARESEARERLREFRAQAAREREEMRAQVTFRSRVRRRVVRDYTRGSTAQRTAARQREESNRNSSRSRYGTSRYRNGRSKRYNSTRRYVRSVTRNYPRVTRIDPQNLPQFAPRVGLMPRYAPRIELAPMPIEALQNPAKMSLPAH
ncbi:hypothetical protein B1R32_11941 [Abditibacterium utsteinense]|uniref:Peptidoglycan hydrolase PcsB coiled-coil domain-containing protein n=1 Tax=Abditibacterium utsteinense TaxID=1960156 RepID=A0A2S8SQ28_9BACT|nr:hypothetical protein [Abditibacterium utsteinense]PQV62901.1 hypothetical protein B1R32_11941 [Abditibacterium utsteinense]